MMQRIYTFIPSIWPGNNLDIDEMKKSDIKCVAIDQSGSLGSLFDKCQDTIVGKLFIDLKSSTFKLDEPIICKLYKGLTPETENLLQMVDLDDLLRVSIILKIIQPSGIASIIDYPRSIDTYTRFLYFYQPTYHESCHDDLIKRKNSQILPILDISATHIITEIISGIHAIVVLQLPSDRQDEIDCVLQQICINLKNKEYQLEIEPTDKDLVDQIISTTVYSNISILTTITTFYDVWQEILRMRDHSIEHRPVKYMLSPIEVFYSNYKINQGITSQDYRNLMKELEQHLLRQMSKMKLLNYRLHDKSFESLQGKLEKQLNNLRQEFSMVLELCTTNIENIRQLTLKMRKEELIVDTIDLLFDPSLQTKIRSSIQCLNNATNELVQKGILVKRIQNDGFSYCDVVELGINQECDEQLVKEILFKNNQKKIILCVTDQLRQESLKQWNTFYSHVIEEGQKNSELTLIYADFTYSTWPLLTMVILLSKEQNIVNYELKTEITNSHQESTTIKDDLNIETTDSHQKPTTVSDELKTEITNSHQESTTIKDDLNIEITDSHQKPTTVSDELKTEITDSHQEPTTVSDELKTEITDSHQEPIIANDELNTKIANSHQEIVKTHSLPLIPTYEFINILLIGESGVGKSTFINAFANYLKFNSLQQAQSGQPIVIIPVSFLITVNDNFDEELVQFGEPDQNENHANTGQSVTQQCRSYVFDIAPNKKLRIIDTPGFGDTRGANQDEMNIEMIFSYINNLSSLNGVCLLFKPNSERLNPFLYSCFTQLFEYFGENVRDHLIFCFTNARSTFFAPGDTRLLLQSLFDSLVVKNIPFAKKNVFCFDSESFRYLVALQKSLRFTDDEINEFERSWTRSVEESNRLRSFLCENLQPYRKSIEWQSIRDAQYQITSMIRPILEAIRNICRNILLYGINSSIKLKARAVNEPTMICYKCNRTPERFNQIWILPDHIHESSNKINIESHANEQNLTEYKLHYEFVDHLSKDSGEDLKQQRTLIYETSIKLAHFLMKTSAKKEDPFLLGLKRMINEEESICHRRHQCNFNQQLTIELRSLIRDYEHLFNKTSSDTENKILSKIYKLIISMNEIPMIKEQMNAIETYQNFLLKFNEQDIDIQNTSS